MRNSLADLTLLKNGQPPFLAFACKSGSSFKPTDKALQEFCICWGLILVKSMPLLTLEQFVVSERAVTIVKLGSPWLDLYFII